MPVFKQSLASLAASSGRAVPPFLESCFSFMMAHLDVEGIFRVPGLEDEIRRAISLADANGTVEFSENTSPFVVANLLTRFILQIPGHILEDKNATEWTNLTDVTKARSLISRLPVINRVVLSRLLGFFLKVAEHSSANRMGIANIAIILRPILISNPKDQWWLIGQDTVTMLLDNYEFIFSEDEVQRVGKCSSLTAEGEFMSSDAFEESMSDVFEMFFAQSRHVQPEIEPVIEEKQRRMCRRVEIAQSRLDWMEMFTSLMSADRTGLGRKAERLTPI